jgi:hypothetical protein
MSFSIKLKELDIHEKDYLKIARKYALEHNYDPSKLFISNDNKHKLMYKIDNKNIKFGNVNNFDYIIYSQLVKKYNLNKSLALKRRELYLNRTKNIKGNWKDNILSKNNLSRKIIWNE